MTLTIHREEDDQRQLTVTVEVEESRVQKAMRNVARQVAREYNFPGFRRGKAPYNVIVRRIGKESLRQDAVEEIIEPIFQEVMAQVTEDVYAQPRLEEMELEPLKLTFILPLNPVVTLGEYRSIRKEIEPIEITEEAIDEAVDRIRQRSVELEEVDRSVAIGDLVTLNGRGVLLADEDESDDVEEAEAEVEEETADDVEAVDDADEPDWEEEEITENIIFDQENVDLIMDTDKIYYGEEFVNNIVGMSAGEENTFTVTFPEDFEDSAWAGNDAEFTISVLNVQQRNLPEVNDEFAQENSTEETVEAWREKLRGELTEAAQEEANAALLDGMTDQLVEGLVEIVYPPTAVDLEIDDMIEGFKNQVTRTGWEWEDFLKMQQQAETDLREEFRENAEERLKRRLVLRQLVFDEKITINEEDVEAAIDEKVARFDNPELMDGMRNYYRSGAAFESISSEILVDKVTQRIKEIYEGNAPDLAELEAALDEEE